MQRTGESIGFAKQAVKPHAEVGKAEVGSGGGIGREAAETQHSVEGRGAEGRQFFWVRPVEAGQDECEHKWR